MNLVFRKLIKFFFGGVLFIVPLLATGYVVYLVFSWFDGLIDLPYYGLSFAIIIATFTFVGYITSNFAFKTFSTWFEKILIKIPLIKLIYPSVKDILVAFVGEEKKFDKPVIVRINKDNNLYRIGFITQLNLSSLNLDEMVVVYFPQSYTFAGDHFLVPKENVKPLDVSGSVAMKFIISGGVSGFDKA